MRVRLANLCLSVSLSAVICTAYAAPVTASAQAVSVSLVDLHQGSTLSDLARFLSIGGYELQDGTWVDFDKWYHTDWIDLHADFLTQFNDDFGILWGFGTGERGEKYRIDPSLKLGIVTQAHPLPNAILSLTATTTLAGSFTEFPCVADFGAIGGVQEVNCRLAAGVLPPADTLKYLIHSDPSRLSLTVAYRANF